MIRTLVFCILVLFSSSYAEDTDCYCGQVRYDRLYAKAAYLLHSSIKDTNFNCEYTSEYPYAARQFYPPHSLRAGHNDSYPTRGKIFWEITKRFCCENSILFNENEIKSGKLSQWLDVPIKIERTIEWFDLPNHFTPFEHKERQIFFFKNDYSAIPYAFQVLKNDVTTYFDESNLFIDERMRDLAKNKTFYQWGGLTEIPATKTKLAEVREEVRNSRQETINAIEQKEAEALAACSQSLEQCMAKHQNPMAYINRGLFYYLEGNSLEALDQIDTALKKAKKEDLEKLRDSCLLLKGLTELEAGYYADAVLTLTDLIEKNPTHKEAYFERAIAHFENGEFDKSLSDYLQSKTEEPEKQENNQFSLDYASGLLEGISKGFQEEFADSLPAWASITALGLWTTFNTAPVPHAKIVSATLSCIAAAAVYLTADRVVGELKELVANWDQLSEKERGALSGYILGKYGTDVFTCAGSAKLAETYRNLKTANQALTLDLALANESNVAALKTKYQKVEKFNQDQAFIQTNFGRKFYPEHEIRDNLTKMGYNVPKSPKGLPENCVTRYSDRGCGISYHDPQKANYNSDRLMPGKPHSPHSKQQTQYILQKRNGHYLDANGKIVHKDSIHAHINPEEYVFRPWDYKPE